MKKGVTFIEIIVVIGLIALIGLTTIPIGASFIERGNLRNKSGELSALLRLAQINSISGKNGTNWGVTVTPGQMVLFSGDSYATRNTDLDETFTVPGNININTGEVVFARANGNPNAPISFNISSNLETVTITVNEIGIVDVN